jgi:hypothetical protein
MNYLFSSIFKKRNTTSITQYSTANLKFPTIEDITELRIETKVWTVGEKYFKLAQEFYGDPEYWWVIAWYNQKPLEAAFKGGDVVEIPVPLELILEFLEIV